MQRSQGDDENFWNEEETQVQDGRASEGNIPFDASSNPALTALQQSIAANFQAAAVVSLLNANNNNVFAFQQQQTIPLLNPALLPFLQGSLHTSSQTALNNDAPQAQVIGGIPLAALLAQGGRNTNVPTSTLNNASLGNQAILANLGLSQASNLTMTGNSDNQASNGAANANVYELFQAMSANTRLATMGGAMATNQQILPLATPADQGATQHQLASLRQNLLDELGKRQAEDQRGFQQLPHTNEDKVAATINAPGDDRKPPPGRQADTSDAATTLMLLQQKAPLSSHEFPLADLVANSTLTKMDLRGLVSDALFVAITQMKPCKLKEDDRVGKYKHRKLGFVGLCCRHCEGQPGFGRYFPGSFDSFLNGKNCDGIVQHIIECQRCPLDIREIIAELERRENSAPTRPKYGSRKRFFAYTWEVLRSTKAGEEVDLQETSNVNDNSSGGGAIVPANVSSAASINHEASSSGATFENPITAEGSISWEALTSKSEIVSLEDRHLISDTLLVALAQMRPCQLTPDDRIGRCKGHNLGFMGMCCRWCGGKTGKPGYGRYFPSSIRSLSQVDSCQHMVKHVAVRCQNCPPAIREIILQLQQADTGRKLRYGSRKMFFRRVWSRLHGEGSSEKAVHVAMKDDIKSDALEVVGTKKVEDEFDWDRLLDGCTLVTEKDKGLIASSQFAAIAQMRICRLTESDRTGWYKKRELNFGGFCCRYCGGRDGRASFGRYFPNTLRSFAQTISSNTIVSHITSYCKKCPDDIRQAVAELYEMDKALQKEKEPGNALYGSRKTFYDRLWSRIHDSAAALHESETSLNHQGVRGAATATIANITDHWFEIVPKPDASYTAGEIHGKRPALSVTEETTKRQKTNDEDDNFTTGASSNMQAV